MNGDEACFTSRAWAMVPAKYRSSTLLDCQSGRRPGIRPSRTISGAQESSNREVSIRKPVQRSTSW